MSDVREYTSSYAQQTFNLYISIVDYLDLYRKHTPQTQESYNQNILHK